MDFFVGAHIYLGDNRCTSLELILAGSWGEWNINHYWMVAFFFPFPYFFKRAILNERRRPARRLMPPLCDQFRLLAVLSPTIKKSISQTPLSFGILLSQPSFVFPLKHTKKPIELYMRRRTRIQLNWPWLLVFLLARIHAVMLWACAPGLFAHDALLSSPNHPPGFL